jgi:HSP20 family protein
MALIRWEPVREMDSLQSEMNRLFDGFFGSRTPNGGAGRRWIPPMDLVETEGEFVLRADLPGMSEEDLEIEVKDSLLTIAGERRSEHDEKGTEGYHRVERAFGSFSRSLSLPDGVAADQVSANFDNGVLEVRIPKPEERKPQQVKIGTGAKPSIEGSGTEK